MNTAVQRDGMPESGPGSPASWPRRIFALLIDWLIANVVAALLTGGKLFDPETTQPWVPLACWLGLTTVTTAFTGASTGQWLLRIRVVRFDRRPMGLPRALARTALIALVVPPLIFDSNGRGLHDKAVDTAAVNAR